MQPNHTHHIEWIRLPHKQGHSKEEKKSAFFVVVLTLTIGIDCQQPLLMSLVEWGEQCLIG